jgi:hypothetical protein
MVVDGVNIKQSTLGIEAITIATTTKSIRAKEFSFGHYNSSIQVTETKKVCASTL